MMELKYLLTRELYTMLEFVKKYEEEVKDYLFHARRHNDKDMEWCYRCNLDLLRTQRMELEYEINERYKEDVQS